MRKKGPKTFVELVKQVETQLKSGQHFFVSYNGKQRDPAVLKSLKLRFLQCKPNKKRNNEYDVELIVDGIWKGRHAPHKFEASDGLLEQLGLNSFELGMGATTYANGTTGKGIRLKVNLALLQGSLSGELEELTGARADKAKQAVLDKVTQSKRYLKAVESLDQVNAQISVLQKQASKLASKVESINLAAYEKAVAAFNATAQLNKPKGNYQVIVAPA